MLNDRKITIFLFIIIIATFALNFPVMANGSDASINTPEASSKNEDTVISLNVKEADIRDVLSALAVTMDKNIIFAGEPSKIDFNVTDMRCLSAFEYLLKASGMDYIQNDTTIIVGTRNVLTQDFFNNISLTKFSLQYVNSDIIASQIEAIAIPVQKVVLGTNQNAIWIQGLPNDLSKVAELIALLDKAENADKEDAPDYMLTPIITQYITAEQLNSVLLELGLYDGLIIETNPMTLWVYGNDNDMVKIDEIKNKVDISQNAVTSSFILKKRVMSFLTNKEIIEIFRQLNVDVNILTIDRKLQTLWLNGNEDSVNFALSIIDQFDIKDHMNDNVFTVYKLKNITAKEAQKRLDQLEIDGVKTYTFNFPDLVKSIMVFYPADYRIFILNHLEQLDVHAETIKVPVDYSNRAGGSSRLRERRDLIVDLTGVPSSKFTISDNVDRGDGYHYIMYLEETPEVIQYIKDVIKWIDNPTAEASGQ